MLNFKGWAKVSEDKQTTTLKHEKGHTMTLAHKKLPKIQQEALKRLKLAEGGEAKVENVGGAGAPAEYVMEDLDAQNKAFKDAPPPSMKDIHAPPQSAPPVVNVNVGAQPVSQPAMAQPVQSANPVGIKQPNVPQLKNPLLANGSMSAPAAAQAGVEGAKLGSEIEAEQARAKTAQEQQYLNQSQQLNQSFVNNLNDLKSKADEFSQWNKENPLRENAYLENMGTGKKIGTAIGLLLSGAGSGVTGGPNLAYEFLNKQIERNIEAQKSRFNQKNTVWGAYKDLYQNEQVADNMARVHALDMLNHQAALTTAQLGTPIAKQKYLELISKTVPERNKLILDSAGSMKSIPMNMPSGSPMAKPTSEPGKEEEKMEEPQASNGVVFQDAKAKAVKSGLPKNDYSDSSILGPNAEKRLAELRYTPKAKEELDQIKAQYTAAQQADTILSQLHEVHQNLAEDTKKSDYSYLRRHNPLSGVPLVGEALSHALLQPKTDTETNRDYQSNRTRIVNDVANAVGPNVPASEIERMVDDNLPEIHDSPKAVAQKERNIRIFIKNHVNKSLIKAWDLDK